MFEELKEYDVLQARKCPTCGEQLLVGDNFYFDSYRMTSPDSDSVCGSCLDDYKKEVINEEGVDGRLLK